MVIMCMACNVLCLTGNEFDYNDLIIAGMDWLTYRETQDFCVSTLAPLWWCYEKWDMGWVAGAILCTGVYPSAVSPLNPGMHIYAIP